jgi:hypothetical protein
VIVDENVDVHLKAFFFLRRATSFSKKPINIRPESRARVIDGKKRKDYWGGEPLFR